MNSGQKESFLCEHGTLVAMSQLASGAAEQKYQHAITNSSGILILVIEGCLNPGKSLKETFELIMNLFASAKGKSDVVGAHDSFLLEDPTKATITSANVSHAASMQARAIAPKGDVNWSDNQKGLQSAIATCGGLIDLNLGTVPTEQVEFATFLLTHGLPAITTYKALIGKCNERVRVATLYRSRKVCSQKKKYLNERVES